MARRLPIAISLLVAASAVHGAGFDCTRAASPVEKSICADRNLSELDEHLARYYAAARAGLNEGARCLQDDQRLWISRRNACRDAGCLERAYLDRLGELDALQPGASAIRHRELPRVPALAWIVPAAADNVAARPDPNARPAEVVGTLLDEVATGDGYVLRSERGERHLVIPLMFLDGATATQLAILAKSTGARYSARGHLVARDGRRDFDPARCVFIHRVAASSPTTPATAEGRVFPDPARQPQGFKPHELGFETPKDGVARTESRSAPFYAVILRTAARCSIKDPERVAAQALFPSAKVFFTRFDCEDGIEEHITYTNVDPKWGFIAVHAGSNSTEAEKMLATVKATGRFPGANVRKCRRYR